MPYAYISDLAGTALAFTLGREPQKWKARHLRIALWVIGLVASLIAHPEGFRILDAELRLPETLFRARVYAVGFPVLETIFVMLRSTASRHEDVMERDR